MTRIHIRRAALLVMLTALVVAVVLIVAGSDPQRRTAAHRAASTVRATTSTAAVSSTVSASAPATTAPPPATTTAPARPRPRPPRDYRLGVEMVRITDPTRMIATANGSAHRALDTIIRYPIARAGQSHGPFPLIVFGHGFAVSPAPYALLLDAWARAGYVVAAPVFPLENAAAPGGPNERDLPNQPGDMSLVISWVTEASGGGSGHLAGIVNPHRIAVSGQSDGGDTALAAAYDPSVRDPRIGAAMILSGAEDPFAAPFTLPRSGPPLLAVQGTADTINPPPDTYLFYREAAPPKFLLQLLGAGHQPPYTEPGAELDAVQRTTLAFLAAVFEHRPRPLRSLLARGEAGPATRLTGVGS